MQMAEALVTFSTLGGIIGVTVAVLEGRPKNEIDLWGSWGTALGFLASLFLAICCPQEL